MRSVGTDQSTGVHWTPNEVLIGTASPAIEIAEIDQSVISARDLTNKFMSLSPPFSSTLALPRPLRGTEPRGTLPCQGAV
jgi:hypothetical protein